MIYPKNIQELLGLKKGDIVIYQKKDLLPVSIYADQKVLEIKDIQVWIHRKETFVKRKYWFGFKRVMEPHSIRLDIKLKHMASNEKVKMQFEYNLTLPNLPKKIQDSIDRTILKDK